MKKILIIILFLISSSTAEAATKYIDNAATGANNGTSWANAYTSFIAARASPGDTVYISGGSTSKTYTMFDGAFHTWTVRTSGQGTAGNPITYRVGQEAGHNGTVILDGENLYIPLNMDTAKYTTISGNYNGENHLQIINLNPSGAVSIYGDNSENIIMEYFDTYGAIRFNGAIDIELGHCLIRPPTLTSVAVIWNVTKRVGEAADYTWNSVHDCDIQLPASNNHPAWGADGIDGGSYSSVYNNNITTYYVPEDVEWQHGDGLQNLAGSGSSVDGSWFRVYNNYFENIGNYGIYWELFGDVINAQFYNNVLVNNDTLAHAQVLGVGIVAGFQSATGKTITNLLIANNTIVDYFGRAAIGAGGNSNTYVNSSVVNNLIYNSGKAGSFHAVTVTGTGWTVSQNLLYAGTRGNTTITNGQTITPSTSVTQPFISYSELSNNNDYHLRSLLPTGTDLSSLFTADKDGLARTLWEMGAYEFEDIRLKIQAGLLKIRTGIIKIQ